MLNRFNTVSILDTIEMIDKYRLDALAHLNQVLCAFSHQVIYRLGSRIHG